MFFVGIFGIHPEEKKIGEIRVENYPNYSIGIKADIYRSNNVFEFFFIPILRFNKKYLIIFPNSKKVFFLEKEIAEDALKRETSISYYDLYESDYCTSCCPGCGRELEGNFRFCPYCGKEL